MGDKKVKSIIYLDTSSEAGVYMKNRRPPANDDELCIGMEPDAYFYLKHRGIEAGNTLPYFTYDIRKDALQKSQDIIGWLEREVKLSIPEAGVQVAYKYSLIFFLRFVVNYCLYMIAVVLDSIDRHKPEVVSAPLGGSKRVQDLFVMPEERYLGLIVNSIAERKSLKFEDVIHGGSCGPMPEIGRSLYTVWRFFLTYGKFKFWSLKAARNRSRLDSNPVLLTTRLYQMGKLYEKLKAESREPAFDFLGGPAIPSFDIPDFISRIGVGRYSRAAEEAGVSLKELQAKIDRETALFSYKDIPFGGIVSKKLRLNIAKYIKGEFLWTGELDRLLDKLRPGAVISAGNRTDDVILAEVCKNKNIPAVLISHGSFARPKNKFEEIEWGSHGRHFLRAPFSHLALQTPLAEGYMETFSSKAKILKTGPLIWGKPVDLAKSRALFKKMFGNKYEFGKTNVLVHAGTTKPSNILRFHIYETQYEYMQTIHDVARAVEKIDNTILIVRFKPSTDISIYDLKALVNFSDKIVLSAEGPFSEILGMADLLISFSSTTIEEALQNRIPVLFYGGGGRYQYLPSHEIRDNGEVAPAPAYFVKEEGALRYALEKILEIYEEKDRFSHLFDPYIYTQRERESIRGLFRSDKKSGIIKNSDKIS